MARKHTLSTTRGSVAGVTARLLLSFLATSSTSTRAAAASWSYGGENAAPQAPILPYLPSRPSETMPLPLEAVHSHEFTLRHIFHHGTYDYPDLHRRLDVRPDQPVWTLAEEGDESIVAIPLHALSRYTHIQRLSDRRIAAVAPLLTAARNGKSSTLPPSAWTMDEVLGPNITDKETVVSLAKVASNAYVTSNGTGEWQEVNGGFNYSNSFGWDADGLRGHIFANEDNSTIVIGLKGTSPAVFDGAETTTNDKVNDNLFFSCCCGQGGQYLWRHVCDCYTTTYTCNQTCLVQSLKKENRYYKAAIELYGNVTGLYPASNVWLAGHSLGGSVSSLLGLTFGLPTVTFEAPPEALAAYRLGLPSPPGSNPSAPHNREYTGAYHFGHTADPIFMGSCNGATAACTLGGYAMESQCHTGQTCVYDVVEDKGWRVSVGTHRIHGVITDVIEAYDEVAKCVPDLECTLDAECYSWKFFEDNGNGSYTTTSRSSSSTTSKTRTEGCKTPGWWFETHFLSRGDGSFG